MASKHLDEIEAASLTVNRRHAVARMNYSTFQKVQDEIQRIRVAAGADSGAPPLTTIKARFFVRPSETRFEIDNRIPGDTIYVDAEQPDAPE